MIYLHTKDPYETKYELLINKRQIMDLKHCDDSKPFIEYSNYMDNINKNIYQYNPNKKTKY